MGGKWKSIPLSQSFHAQGGDFSCLGGIEELTDYSFVTKGSVSGKVVKKNVNAKKETIFPNAKETAVLDKKPEKRKIQKPTNDEVVEPKKIKKNVEVVETKKINKNVFTVTDISEDKSKSEAGEVCTKSEDKNDIKSEAKEAGSKG